jgi:GcrA cell cycle regulator
MQMRWTAEAVEDLKRLALEGRSASVIAAALGTGSRNAVIGKASRIGIKLNGGGRAPVLRQTAAGARRAPWTPAPHPRSGAGKPSFAAALAPDAGVIAGPQPGNREERRAAWTFAEAEVGEMRRVRFEEIRESACRWPLGDPKGGELVYCGREIVRGQSYCAGHCRMAYRPPQARQSRRDGQGLRAIASSWRLA